MAGNRAETRTGGRSASQGVIPGDFALSVGKPERKPPSGWSWTALTDVARLESGHTPSRKHPEYWDGDVPWIGIKDATENHGCILQDTLQHTNELGISNSSARVLPRNTVCLSRTASVGYVVVMGRPMATSQDFVNWVCSEAIDFRYLKYVLLSERAAFLRFASGTTHQTIYFPEVKAFHVCLPPLPEQRAIAHILGTLDDKIELNRRRNQTLEVMARALFKDWFVDFGPVRAKMEGREPYLPADLWQLFPDRLDDEGKPEGWGMVPASELIEFNPTEPLRKGTPAPYLDMASLPTSGSWPESPVIRDFGSGMRFRNGDTLLARITPCLENGKTAFVQCLPDDTVGWGSTEYIVMRPKAPVPAGYAYLLARDDAFREHAIRSMTGTSGRQRAQGDSVAAFKLASPPGGNVWHAFAKQAMPIFGSIKSNATASETLAQLRDTLLPKLICGELRIKDAERFIEERAL